MLRWLSNHCREVQSLGGGRVLFDTFAHQSDEEWITTLDFTLDLVEPQVRVSNSWMEGDFQIKRGVRVHIALLWGDGEMLAVDFAVPLEGCFHITKVRNLQDFGQARIADNAAKSDNCIHQLHFDAVTDSYNLDELSALIVLDVEQNVQIKVRHSGLWSIPDLHRNDLSWFKGDLFVWCN